MRTIIIAIIFILSIFYTYAQSTENPVEVRYSLLQHINANGLSELALSISVINHSDQNIYIPNFALFSRFSGTHFYQKEGDLWKEIDIITHDYYYLPQPQIARPGIGHYDRGLVSHYKENEISKHYQNKLLAKQDSIANKFYNENDGFYPKVLKTPEDKPLFLKAHEELTNLTVLALDYLLTNPKEYKIAFDSEIRDKQTHFRDSSQVINYQTKEYFRMPDHIYEYNLYTPKTITSNAIYFTTLVNGDLK